MYKRQNVGRIQTTLAAHGLTPAVDLVEFRGATYNRVRLGPYPDADGAAGAAHLANRLFDVQSAVIPVLE